MAHPSRVATTWTICRHTAKCSAPTKATNNENSRELEMEWRPSRSHIQLKHSTGQSSEVTRSHPTSQQIACARRKKIDRPRWWAFIFNRMCPSCHFFRNPNRNEANQSRNADPAMFLSLVAAGTQQMPLQSLFWTKCFNVKNVKHYWTHILCATVFFTPTHNFKHFASSEQIELKLLWEQTNRTANSTQAFARTNTKHKSYTKCTLRFYQIHHFFSRQNKKMDPTSETCVTVRVKEIGEQNRCRLVQRATRHGTHFPVKQHNTGSTFFSIAHKNYTIYHEIWRQAENTERKYPNRNRASLTVSSKGKDIANLEVLDNSAVTHIGWWVPEDFTSGCSARHRLLVRRVKTQQNWCDFT